MKIVTYLKQKLFLYFIYYNIIIIFTFYYLSQFTFFSLQFTQNKLKKSVKQNIMFLS